MPSASRIEQGILGNDEPRARRTDPVESHQAAGSVTGLTQKQSAVLGLLSAIGPCTDRKLVDVYKLRSTGLIMANARDLPRQSESGIRTRRKELTDKGLIAKVGTERLESGRLAASWRVIFDSPPDDAA